MRCCAVSTTRLLLRTALSLLLLLLSPTHAAPTAQELLSATTITITKPIKLPLTLYNRRAYLTKLDVDGTTYTMQVSTKYADVWMACSRFQDKTCSYKCDAIVQTELQDICGTRSTATLSAGSLDLSSFPILVQQDRKPYPKNRTLGPGMSEPVEVPNHRLVDDAEGQLGLGRAASETSYGSANRETRSIMDSIGRFSVYLDDYQASSSFLLLGGVNEPKMASGGRVGMILPLLPVKHTGWPVNLTAIQYGDLPRQYPRAKDQADDGSAPTTRAVLSLNDPVIRMPASQFEAFYKTFLPESICKYQMDNFVHTFVVCPTSIVDTLPRIALYFGGKGGSESVVYLSPVDYTRQSPTDAAKTVIMVTPPGPEDGDTTAWSLGIPFLRKFPTLFDATSQYVKLYCLENESCKSTGSFETPVLTEIEEETTAPEPPRTPGPSSSGSSSTSAPPRAVPTYPSTSSSSGLSTEAWVMINGIALVCVGAVLLLTSRKCRARGRTPKPDVAMATPVVTTPRETDFPMMIVTVVDGDEHAVDYIPTAQVVGR